MMLGDGDVRRRPHRHCRVFRSTIAADAAASAIRANARVRSAAVLLHRRRLRRVQRLAMETAQRAQRRAEGAEGAEGPR